MNEALVHSLIIVIVSSLCYIYLSLVVQKFNFDQVQFVIYCTVQFVLDQIQLFSTICKDYNGLKKANEKYAENN